MSKKKPCGLDYCPQEEIVGAYASCLACAWGKKYDSKDNKKEWIIAWIEKKLGIISPLACVNGYKYRYDWFKAMAERSRQ